MLSIIKKICFVNTFTVEVVVVPLRVTYFDNVHYMSKKKNTIVDMCVGNGIAGEDKMESNSCQCGDQIRYFR